MMGKYLKQCDKDYLKMAMLKQERTFREQLSELHRLYRVQKLLVEEIGCSELKRQRRSGDSPNGLNGWNEGDKRSPPHPSDSYHDRGRPKRSLDLERPADEFSDDSDEGLVLEIDQETDVELTLAIGSSWRKKDDTADSGASISSSSIEEAGFENLKPNHWGRFHMPGVNLNYPSESDGVFDVGQPRLNQPSWHFQCLSLNMT